MFLNHTKRSVFVQFKWQRFFWPLSALILVKRSKHLLVTSKMWHGDSCIVAGPKQITIDSEWNFQSFIMFRQLRLA